MKINLHTCTVGLCLTFAVFPAQAQPSVKTPPDNAAYQQWVEKSLEQMETVKVGMTRADLLKIFIPDGGLQYIPARIYVYRGCPLFKVDVEFQSSGKKAIVPILEDPADIITDISHPYTQQEGYVYQNYPYFKAEVKFNSGGRSIKD